MLPAPCLGWDGEFSDTGDSVEIESGNLVREGMDADIYMPYTGETRTVHVEDINRDYNGVEIEIYDYESGEYQTLEMEGRH